MNKELCMGFKRLCQLIHSILNKYFLFTAIMDVNLFVMVGPIL